jgi:NTP pyrophosphatase (non-canonical NTP hydrolase)
MELDDYQQQAIAFAIFPASCSLVYPALALSEECGELNGKIAKCMRDGTEFPLDAIRKECGDVLWQLNAVVSYFGWSLSDVATENIAKLTDRKARKVLSGSGDNR